MIRWAAQDDKSCIYELWERCFYDPKPWMDWFFSQRYSPERTLCCRQDGQIVSSLQVYPYPLKVRSCSVDALCVSGISTHPDWRGKGYMGKTLTQAMKWAAEKNYLCLFNMPQSVNYYEKYNHLYCSDRLLAELQPREATDQSKEFTAGMDCTPLLPCYHHFLQHYSGLIARTPALFRLRLDDIFADRGQALTVTQNGQVTGYALYAAGSDLIDAIEVVYADQKSFYAVIDSLLYRAKGRKVKLSLPTDVAGWLTACACKISIRPMNVLRVLHPEKLLALQNFPMQFTIGISDPFLPQNNHVFSSNGEKKEVLPDWTMDIGHFGQWISGYRSLTELLTAGHIIAKSPSLLAEIDQFLPACACYSLEAY